MAPQWVRPGNVPFPTVWLTFEAKESKESNRRAKFIVQDLPEDRSEDAIRHMTECYMVDHPLTPTKDGLVVDEDFVEDFQRSWRIVLKQKCSVVCFREDSDEIVGLNLHYIYTKDDPFLEDIYKFGKSKGYLDNMKLSAILYANLCPFAKYDVEYIFECFGLSVHPKYRGSGIAQRILESRKPVGIAFGLKLTHCRFSNEQASKIADRIGFKVDVEYTIDELNEIDPSLAYENVKTNKIAIKTWEF